MVTMSSGVTAGWGYTGDRHVLLRGTGFSPSANPLVVYCHALGGGGPSVLAVPQAFVLARWNYPVVSADMGSSRVGGVEDAASEWYNPGTYTLSGSGPEQYTGDKAMTALDNIYDNIRPTVSTNSKMLIIGASCGAAIGAKYAHDHPDRVAACLFMIGVVDLEHIRANNLLSQQAPIGVKLGNPVPVDRNPADMAADWPIGVPVWHLYNGDDSVCDPARTVAFCATINGLGGTAIATEKDPGDHNMFAGLAPYVQESCGWLVKQA